MLFLETETPILKWKAFVAGIVVLAAAWFVFASGGVVFWLAATTFVTGLLLVLRIFSKRRLSAVLASFALLSMSLGVASAGLEAFLIYDEETVVSRPAVAAPAPVRNLGPMDQSDGVFSKGGALYEAEARAATASRSGYLTMPPTWAKRIVEVEGAKNAYYWHEALHVHDENNLRRTTPFPPKRDGVLRIVVLGDSLTYGYGVREKWTYPALLEKFIAKSRPVEVINLGVAGAQSEDILNLLRRLGPRLKPDLIVYGMTLNDFLPSGIAQYNNLQAYALPLPDAFKNALVARTRLVRFLSERYDTMLRRTGVRVDFYDDILKDFKNYQIRFTRDVAAINSLAQEIIGRPVISMALDQYPDLRGRERKIAIIAEEAMRAAGMNVIATAPYYRLFDRRLMRVSRWEGHPNEEAHAIWAAAIGRYLKARGLIDAD